MSETESVFEIGLAMAGAISAGAYSAGVLDFLFQALDAWEQAKKERPDEVPNHSVCIKVVAGASAGAITGALGVAALAGGLRSAPYEPARPPSKQQHKYVLPPLYDAWVVMPDLASPTGGNDLLSLSDLGDPKTPIASLLNSAILQDIANRALELPPDMSQAIGNLPYIGKPLHVYMMVSNMRGVPYKVKFNSQTVDGHYMVSHGDRIHYALTGLGGGTPENAWCKDDQPITLDIADLPRHGQDVPEDWRDYAIAALASSAFPVGLAPRKIEAKFGQYEKRQWPSLQGLGGAAFSPEWPTAWHAKDDGPFKYLTMDGGLIDNEPFEYAHQGLLTAKAPTANPPLKDDAIRAVVMIDPFPEPPEFSSEEVALKESLSNVVMSLFPVLKNQARFKPRELLLAMDENVYSRWLIAPRRTAGKDTPERKAPVERYAIATGLLGGFGGFADRVFRDHDYQLGRRNCQKFLRTVFTVGAGNNLALQWKPDVRANADFWSDGNDGPEYCIIPLVGSAALTIDAEPWPRISLDRLATLERRIAERAAVLVPQVIARQIKSPGFRSGLRKIWSGIGSSKLANFVHWTVLSDLVRRDQIEMPWPLGPDERVVYAELAAPKYDYRTVNGLVESTGLSPNVIAVALLSLTRKERGLIWQGRIQDSDCYALSERRPGWFKRNTPGFSGEPSIG